MADQVESPSAQQPSTADQPPSSSLSRSSPGPERATAAISASPHSDSIEAAPLNPRLQAIENKKATLLETFATLEAQRTTLVAETKLPVDQTMQEDWSEEQKTKAALDDANAVIKQHIARLHKYNEIKDIGQGLMGMIAESRGVRIATVMEDFGMDEQD